MESTSAGGRAGGPHFRAHERRPVRLSVGLVEARSGLARHATVIDISIAGAGLELEDALVPGERVQMSFATPTMWDPLVVPAIVVWAATAPARDGGFGRGRMLARAGVAFDYPAPDLVLSVFEMLSTLGYE